MQLGFVIDHSRCIGCHACTVACKAENDVPVGSFRTWVKYTESGSFPQVRRSFAVLRCNQCTDAPCVTICPTRALEKRSDGIVDIDPDWCIGCKSCMQGCPYDALYINDATGIAEKCHFCAHRTEQGLAPACAIVCPTEAIIPGDFHDGRSVVSKMVNAGGLRARKREAGTGPNVWYREVAPAGVEPLETTAGRGSIWADQVPGLHHDVELWEAAEAKASDRTVYDVQHPAPWGWKISTYLWTKSIAAGAMLVPGLIVLLFRAPALVLGWGPPLAALAFLVATLALLVFDLKRPERFWYMLRRPNWSSWVTQGAVILTAYGGILALWLVLLGLGARPGPVGGRILLAATLAAAALTACYTAWLFAQSKGRVLWMKRGLAVHLLIQAGLAGVALYIPVVVTFMEIGYGLVILRGLLGVFLVLHAVFALTERAAAPARREREYERAAEILTRGPLKARYRFALLAGVLAPILLLPLPVPAAWSLAGLLALAGLWVYEDAYVRAGQALAIS